MPLTQDRLKEVLDYNPGTGVFTWRVQLSRRVKVGDVAGWRKFGYTRIRIFGAAHFAHRLAWLYVHGEFPCGPLDHKNGNRSDNCISNLRTATPSQNGANRKVSRNGLKGAAFNKIKKKWQAKVCKDGKLIHAGYHASELEAHKAYMKAAREVYGEFARAA